MVIAWPRCIGHDDLVTAVRGVVRSLPFLAIVMSDVVGVLFVKLKVRFPRSFTYCFELICTIII